MMTFDLPLTFIKKIHQGFGDTGTVWLMDLPETVDHCVQQWQLTDLRVCDELSYNLILFAQHADYGDVVLKIGVPHLDLFSEMEAIQLYDGRGICRCFDIDEAHAAMLLERVLPGQDLRSVMDADERYNITADLFRLSKTPVPESCNLPTYQSLIERAIERIPQNRQVPEKLVKWLRQIKAEHQTLVKHSGSLAVLHCDLHHMNILRSGEGWKLIDPKGFIGVPAMECIRFMQNELGIYPPLDRKAAIEKMISVFAPALEVSPNLVWRCFFVDSVLSTYWGYEDDSSAEWLQEGVTLCEFLEREKL